MSFLTRSDEKNFLPSLFPSLLRSQPKPYATPGPHRRVSPLMRLYSASGKRNKQEKLILQPRILLPREKIKKNKIKTFVSLFFPCQSFSSLFFSIPFTGSRPKAKSCSLHDVFQLPSLESSELIDCTVTGLRNEYM